ncbi:MAG: T9SS type A sorting domain-containing protein [Cytophagales bacterium]|nr:T9SS type A sorting domain-containing protein [Cytophagales bacterium]MDW8384621.1 T9SS type A sorting domain-containing protein [Flammeovirgaceae bacterium]
MKVVCYAVGKTIVTESAEPFEASVYTTTGVHVGSGAKVSVVSSGIYLVHIKTTTGTKTVKVLVE